MGSDGTYGQAGESTATRRQTGFRWQRNGVDAYARQDGCKWTLRFTSPATGKRRDAGLGVNPEVTIVDAPEKALAMRGQRDVGKVPPIDERNREQAAASIAVVALTFEKAARSVHEEPKPGWRDEKHAVQLIGTLEAYVFPQDRHEAA